MKLILYSLIGVCARLGNLFSWRGSSETHPPATTTNTNASANLFCLPDRFELCRQSNLPLHRILYWRAFTPRRKPLRHPSKPDRTLWFWASSRYTWAMPERRLFLLYCQTPVQTDVSFDPGWNSSASPQLALSGAAWSKISPTHSTSQTRLILSCPQKRKKLFSSFTIHPSYFGLRWYESNCSFDL